MGFALSKMQLASTAFADGGAIPVQHTGDGADTSPPLRWSAVPDSAVSFAVVCHDPDAPLIKNGSYGFVHWVLYNLPRSTTALEAGTDQGTPGSNDFGKAGYGGPMPPEGHGTHHYFFWVLALDRELSLPQGLSLRQLLDTIEPHVIAMNRLVGTYRRG